MEVPRTRLPLHFHGGHWGPGSLKLGSSQRQEPNPYFTEGQIQQPQGFWRVENKTGLEGTWGFLVWLCCGLRLSPWERDYVSVCVNCEGHDYNGFDWGLCERETISVPDWGPDYMYVHVFWGRSHDLWGTLGVSIYPLG